MGVEPKKKIQKKQKKKRLTCNIDVGVRWLGLFRNVLPVLCGQAVDKMLKE
jgi:hypothetical protein